MNAGLYVFSTIVLLCGFAAELSREPESGLVLLLIALLLVAAVNLHDLLAHLAGINYRLCLFGYDLQLALVEFASPLLHILGCICSFLGILFLFIQKLENHAINLLIAGPALWVLGSILNSCQIYERAGGHLQLLQHGVHVPFLMASLLFLVASFLMSPDTQARHQHDGGPHHQHDGGPHIRLLGGTWVWLGIFGSLLLFVGGLANVVKVFSMQQRDDGVMRLERLRGGSQEQLLLAMNLESDGRGGVPFIVREDDGEERWRKHRHSVEEGGRPAASDPTPTPYKDVLVGQV
ncbi:unnamed protein product [Cuscuta campestris]|uniref:Uncharacterized protein n=1 Tax=Cuscuta campestris TaxID=132261 RepID=A0A484K103_9ASTE|nr:unnamed protein product [Cuscuta campestris]